MKKHPRKSRKAVRTAVTAEMALPRMSKSARIAERASDTGRVSEKPKTIIPGTVDKIIRFRTPLVRETAQISIDGEQSYRELRVENSLTDEHGDEVKLTKGDQVEVTITTDGKRS